MDLLQSTLMRYEPISEAQKALALETIASFDRMMDARRMRLDSVKRRLPGVLWLVILVGAFISLVSTFHFPVLDARVHRAQVALLAAFIGLVIFIIMALDRPYDGDLGLKPEPYETVYQQLMAH
jgi:ABC-type Co2+ transport system permease subunit